MRHRTGKAWFEYINYINPTAAHISRRQNPRPYLVSGNGPLQSVIRVHDKSCQFLTLRPSQNLTERQEADPSDASAWYQCISLAPPYLGPPPHPRRRRPPAGCLITLVLSVCPSVVRQLPAVLDPICLPSLSPRPSSRPSPPSAPHSRALSSPVPHHRQQICPSPPPSWNPRTI